MKSLHIRLRSAFSLALILLQILFSIPGDGLAGLPIQSSSKPAAPKVLVNRKLPPVLPVPSLPRFSNLTTDDELFKARVFEEPLVPMSGPSEVGENQQLASAVLEYLSAGNTERLTPLERFLDLHPTSRWRVSLLTNMGIVYRRTGYFTKALVAWEEAWTLGKNETAPFPRAVAERAVSEWAELNARVGRMDVLGKLFDELADRDIAGSAGEKLRGARQGLWLMQNKPEDAFRCGPFALDRILAFENKDYKQDRMIPESRSTVHGMSLTQVWKLSWDLHMNMRMARRTGDTEIPLPALVHWKAGHYAALLKEEGGRYLVQDPTFGDEFWVSRQAVNHESSGYFLIKEDSLGDHWGAVSESQGDHIWGKGNTGDSNKEATRPYDAKADPNKCTPQRMASYNIHLMLVSLNISDSPVGYTPPRGPSVEFQATYNQKETFQPSIFTYSNLGPKWTFDWLSYIKDDPSNPYATAFLYVRGGGQETYTNFNPTTQSYAPHLETRAILVRTATSPIRYERRLSDGSVEVFSQPDSPTGLPRRVFMTEWRDAAGNALTFAYDSNLRLIAIADAIGQVTTISYELTSDPFKITKVVDPFGRSAIFEYTDAGRLRGITDVIGIQSQFTYGPGDFINALTTPYGTTTFIYREKEVQNRWLEATDPLGATERVEYRNGGPLADNESSVPSGMTVWNAALAQRNSYFWDKRAFALYAGDYSKAKIYHFLHLDGNTTSGIIESTKWPFENRVWYQYPDQSSPLNIGSTAQPTMVGRVLDDGSTQLYKYEYNLIGKVTRLTDPLGRETVFQYGTNNIPDAYPATGTSVDVLSIQQKRGAAYDVLKTITYNGQHLPITVTDAALQTTTFTYRTTGDPETIVTPARNSLTEAQRTTTFTYFADNAPLGPAQVSRIAGPVSGANTDFTYDGLGRVRTTTDSDGYTLTTDYDSLDRPTRVTYPDDTFEENDYARLDLTDTRDRLGRWTHYLYDANGRLIITRDPLGHAVSQEWCSCGTLTKVVDANGNATRWEFDAAGRVINEVRADNSKTQFIYENTTSRLKRRTDPKGQHRDIVYLKDNDIQQINYPNAIPATPAVTFTYDPSYNRVTTRVDGIGTTSYAYYPVTQQMGTAGATLLATVDGPLANDTMTYTYDELGRVVGRSINSVAATQVYDGLGRIVSSTNVLGTFNYTYVNQTSRVQSVSYPNGQTNTYSYLPNSGDRRLQQILNQKAGGITLSKFDYIYDATGNIKTWTQQSDSSTPKAYDFIYDATDQLIAATWRTAEPVPSILARYAYSYDSAGNRTTEQIDDAPLKAAYNNMNRILSQDPGGMTRFSGSLSEAARVTIQNRPAVVTADNKFTATARLADGTNTVDVKATDYSGNVRTSTYQMSVSGSTKIFTHDANGNLTSDGSRSFEWDGENRLVAVNNDSHRSEFTYDGVGDRVRLVEKNGGATIRDTWLLWCQIEICEERDSTGATVTKRFFQTGEQQGAASLYYTRDHLSSIHEMMDNTAATRARYEYDPYGRTAKVFGDMDTSFTFTNYYAHATSGLLLARYRAYDSSAGRWFSEDPVGDAVNAYVYVNNNSMNRTDPFGLWTMSIGLQVNYQIGPISAQGFAGIAIDSAWGLGLYWGGGGAAGIGAGGSGGLSIQASNAKTINDLSGLFANGSVGGAYGASASLDQFHGLSDNGVVSGGGVTIGIGLGGGASVGVTDTVVKPLLGPNAKPVPIPTRPQPSMAPGNGDPKIRPEDITPIIIPGGRGPTIGPANPRRTRRCT